MFKSNYFLAACCAFLPDVALAQHATDLDEVIVTATRTASSANESLAATEVIDRAQIERSHAQSLPELLRGHAGVQLANQGGMGKLTTLFLRGTESDHVLVLMDGVRIGSATAGLAALQDLPLEQIDRIEIVRGPRSSVYGADAIGGVIQIFTRSGSQGRLTNRFSIGAGSHGSRQSSAGFDVNGKRGWLGADAAWQRTDGINACNLAAPTPFSGGCFIAAPQPDRDGYRNASLSLRSGWTNADAWTVEARALRAQARNYYDGDLTDRSDTVQQVLAGKASWQPSTSFLLTVSVGRNVDLSEDALQARFVSRFNSTRDNASLQTTLGKSDTGLLSIGVDWLRDAAKVTDAFSPFQAQRRNQAVFAQYQRHAGGHALQAALRVDRDDQFGTRSTGNVSLGIAFARSMRITASYGTAFKAPTFNELYYPFFGNPQLRPETSHSFEVGLSQKRTDWHWRIDAYHTQIDDLIAFDAALNLPNNLQNARIRGAEFIAGTQLALCELSTQLSYTDARNGDLYLPRRARLSGRIDIDRAFGDWKIGASMIGQNRRFDDVANTRALGGYSTLNLRVDYALSSTWKLQTGIDNAFDKSFQTAAFYNQPRREWVVRVRYRDSVD